MPKVSQLPPVLTSFMTDAFPMLRSGGDYTATLQQMGIAIQTQTPTLSTVGSVSIFNFIPVSEQAAIIAGTSTYDCAPAINTAVAYALQTYGSPFYASTNSGVYFPLGKYKVNSTISLTNQVRLWGNGGGFGYSLSPTLVFPAGITGIYALPYQVGTSAAGAILEGLTIQGALGAADGLGGHGIYSRITIQVRNCQVFDFQGNGVNIDADTAGIGILLGNANGWSLRDVTVKGCNHGVYVHGGDANAGLALAVNVTSARGWGIWDSSFLGNSWVGCEVAACTTGAYQTDNLNARIVLIGCYSEGGTPTSVFTNLTQVFGGLHGAGTSGGSYYSSDASGAFITNTAGFQAPTFKPGYGQPNTSGVGVQFKDTGGTFSWTLGKATGRWGYQWANLATPRFFTFYDRTATVANGYVRDLSVSTAPAGNNGNIGIEPYYFGSISQMKYRGLGSAAPVSGDYLVGDIIENSAPAASGFIGWVCTAAGNPGTWKTYGAISA